MTEEPEQAETVKTETPCPKCRSRHCRLVARGVQKVPGKSIYKRKPGVLVCLQCGQVREEADYEALKGP